MKILIIYYSRTGLTGKIAGRLADALGAEKEEITDTADRSGVIGYLRCGREAMQKTLPPINAPKNNPADYDLVIIGTPVWAATMASPVRAYLVNNRDRFKRAAFFLTHGGTGSDKTFAEMAEVSGLKPEATLVVLSREVVKGGYEEKFERFIKALGING